MQLEERMVGDVAIVAVRGDITLKKRGLSFHPGRCRPNPPLTIFRWRPGGFAVASVDGGCMKRTVLAVVPLLFLVGSAASSAHHSYSGFSANVVTIEGRLERVMFANPHVTLTIRTSDSSIYTAVWVAAFTLENRGMAATELKVGDLVVVSGTPALDPTVHELARIEEVRRVSDGWRWLKNETGRGPTIASPR